MRAARYIIVALAVAQAAPQALAQQNSVVEHYRAYVAALDRGDEQAAAQAAQAALAASEARDGDGGRTGVLALNLAIVSMMTGEHETARAAGERALALAQTGAVGVDPNYAELIVARATLALASDAPEGPAAAARLDSILNAPARNALPDEELYLAAAQLGAWGFAHDGLDIAQRAWAVAGAHPAGSPFGETYGLGRARAYEGIAIVLSELQDRRRRPIDEDAAADAHELLSEATRLLSPASEIDSPTLELTLAQQTYAEARAWILALRSKMESDGRPLPDLPTEAQGDADGLSEIGPVDITRPRCMLRVVATPQPRYPDLGQVAAVVLFYRVNEEGEIVAHQVAARAGSEEFADSIERVIGRWRVERLDTSAPNCRMEASLLHSVRFVVRP